MKIQNFLILAGGLALISFIPGFAAGSAGRQAVDDLFRISDTNHDGRLSRTEHAATSRKMFVDMDADHDGSVNAREMTAVLVKQDGSVTDLLKQHDQNEDGKLSAAEHGAAWEVVFTESDTNHDGTLSVDECDDGRIMIPVR